MVGPAGPPTIVAEGAEDTGAALSDVEEAQRPKYRHRSPRRKSRSGPQGVGPSPPPGSPPTSLSYRRWAGPPVPCRPSPAVESPSESRGRFGIQVPTL